jgi:hypothetical protein
MGRSQKAKLPWVDAVGTKVVEQLASWLHRPFLHFQSGPYTQDKYPMVEIYFNDPVLHYIRPRKQAGRTDFRFGFFIDRRYSSQQWTLAAGFQVLNSTLATLFLMKNIGDHCEGIAAQLHQWLIEHSGRAFCSFAPEHTWDGRDTAHHISDQLRLYIQQRRKPDSMRWKRSKFEVGMNLSDLPDLTEEALANSANLIASTTVPLFKELDFLYNMLLPHTIAPARLSNGQNRALRRVQPNFKCAWTTQEHCDGQIEAAHIKPDRVGGRAVGKNLFWLCDFHHDLLDIYFRAELDVDRQGRRIVAKVKKQPTQKVRDGIPLAIWEGIVDKNRWPLPLQPDSISHLFEAEGAEVAAATEDLGGDGPRDAKGSPAASPIP